jgi:hypothetical protein
MYETVVTVHQTACKSYRNMITIPEKPSNGQEPRGDGIKRRATKNLRFTVLVKYSTQVMSTCGTQASLTLANYVTVLFVQISEELCKT